MGSGVPNYVPMTRVVKLLSHYDRVSGREIAGGSQIAPNHWVGKILVSEIQRGFFEKKAAHDTQAGQLFLSFALFHTFRQTSPN